MWLSLVTLYRRYVSSEVRIHILCFVQSERSDPPVNWFPITVIKAQPMLSQRLALAFNSILDYPIAEYAFSFSLPEINMAELQVSRNV